VSVKTIESGIVADAYVELLVDRGIEFLFANAGTDFAPLIESLAKFEAQGRQTPKPIIVPHENVAIHMALGHYLQSGRPQLVMVHVNVGTANAMCGLINAWRGNLPVIFTSGRTPYSEEGGVSGGRSGEIHWPQEMRDQAAMVREVVGLRGAQRRDDRGGGGPRDQPRHVGAQGPRLSLAAARSARRAALQLVLFLALASSRGEPALSRSQRHRRGG
jgi:Thiamine pyrophosphate enzyme, N-terminal TPP binding domain